MELPEKSSDQVARHTVKLADLGRLFLKLGCVGFGGPLAHMALIQEECVEKRRWIPHEEFLHGWTLCQLLPGPASTQLAIFTGYRTAGLMGGVVSGCAFILPAFFLLLLLTWAYFRFGAIPAVQGIFYGMTPVVLAMILVTGYRLATRAATDRFLYLLLSCSVLLVALGSANIVALFAVAALAGILLYGPRRRESHAAANLFAASPLPLLKLGWFFLKVGSLIFGGGLVIIPFIQKEVVDTLGWLTRREFLDGLALGQMTPGPVVITATFIGYKVAGAAGALVATAAIFFPSFVFVFVGATYLRKIERSNHVKAMLKTLNVAAVGAILGALWPLARGSLFHVFPLLLFGVSLVALLACKMNFLKVLAAGALMGWIAHGMLALV